MSRERNSEWRRENGLVAVYLAGSSNPQRNAYQEEADALVAAGTHLYDPADKTRIMEIPGDEQLKSADSGALRGASCNLSGAENHRHEIAVATDRDGRVITEDGVPFELF